MTDLGWVWGQSHRGGKGTGGWGVGATKLCIKKKKSESVKGQTALKWIGRGNRGRKRKGKGIRAQPRDTDYGGVTVHGGGRVYTAKFGLWRREA